MKSIVKLQEKGFGGPKFGTACIVCGMEGEVLSMRLNTLPNGAIGGDILLIQDSHLQGSRKSYMHKSARHIFVNRYNKDLATVKILTYEDDGMMHQMECGASIGAEIVSFFSSDGMENSEEAKELLKSVLFIPFIAALNRSNNAAPDKMYHGKLAEDGKHQIISAKPKVTVG